MNNRYSDRIPVELEAEVVLDNHGYEGKIENISDEGIFLKAFSDGISLDFTGGTIIQLKPDLPFGEQVELECRVVWSKKDKENRYTNEIGLEILNPPPSYDEYVKTLLGSQLGVL